MVQHVTTLLVPNPIVEAFEFLGDLRNSAHWDPRVRGVEKLTPGPIGQGTSFVLASAVGMGLWEMSLPYQIAVYEAPRRITFTGESLPFAYHDHITFAASEGGTMITYHSYLYPKGILRAGRLLARIAFHRVAEDATRGIENALRQRAQRNA